MFFLYIPRCCYLFSRQILGGFPPQLTTTKPIPNTCHQYPQPKPTAKEQMCKRIDIDVLSCQSFDSSLLSSVGLFKQRPYPSPMILLSAASRLSIRNQ